MSTHNHLVCARGGQRLLLDANDVLAVREVTVQTAPPSSPTWLAGIAVEADATVVVVRIDERPPESPQRVALLRPRGEQTWHAALAVDHVEGFASIDGCNAARDSDQPWLCRCLDGSLVLQPERLHEQLQPGNGA
jgi:hypothetical protein